MSESFGVKLHVWGPKALFTRPELKTERYSYDVITPSAARGILESIYWHPGMVWKIDKIHVNHPIKRINVRRNEIKSKASASNMLQAFNGKRDLPHVNRSEEIIQRMSSILTDVDYVIEAHFDMTDKANETDNPGKFSEIFKRRVRNGQCFKMPCFGCREFPANFELAENLPESYYKNDKEHDFGLMLYDLDYKHDKTPLYYHAVMKHGVITVKDCEVYQ